MNVVKQFDCIFIFIVIAATMTSAQQPCCSPTEQFAAFSTNAAFRLSHDVPTPFAYAKALGSNEFVTTNSGKKVKIYKVKGGTQSRATVLVFHEWWGLNDYIKQQCDEIYKSLDEKSTVIAVDLFGGTVATNRNQAATLMQGVDDAEAREGIRAVLKEVPSDNSIGTVGWCFGGGWSMQATLIAQRRAKACVIYYGMPELDRDKLQSLNAPVLGIFAEKDAWITRDVVNGFQQAMTATGNSLTVKYYNADHAFANPSNPNHDSVASADAYNLMINFFKENLLK
ncbi:MAG: dienelactone hydrolase family protein [Ignavibacteria bacterium]|nr:dienelactone hydrolase family protein [Ignavibacteria bacterium]